jgi:hypothetical protein
MDNVDTLSQSHINVCFREICETLDFKFPDLPELTFTKAGLTLRPSLFLPSVFVATFSWIIDAVAGFSPQHQWRVQSATMHQALIPRLLPSEP